MRRLWVVTLSLTALGLAACGRGAPSGTTGRPATAPAGGLSGSLNVAGSTTVQPLAERLAEAFSAQHPGVVIDVKGGGSSVGIKSAGQGTVDIGMASREVKDSELKEFPGLKVYRIAVDGVAIVVNPAVGVSGLSKQQVQGIFSGAIANWREVGGADAPIIVVAREEGSGTREFFQQYFMGADKVILDKAILQSSNGAVRTTVASTPNSIGFLSFGYVDQSVKALRLDGVAPTEANVQSGAYGAWRYLNLLTRGQPAGLAKAWIDFILSPEGQQIVVKEGYLGVK